MKWEVRKAENDSMPWKVCLINEKFEIIYGAAFNKAVAEITVDRLNKSEEDDLRELDEEC